MVQLPHFSWLFTVYYRDMSGKEFRALYGNLTRDAAPGCLPHPNMCISSTNLLKYLLFYKGIVACLTETGLAHFLTHYSCNIYIVIAIATQNGRL